MPAKIAIIDCGTGNLASVANAFRFLDAEAQVVSTPREVEAADKIVLPGVGSFGYFMEQLRSNGLDGAVKDAVAQKKHYLGICLGMQVLFEESEESPGAKGLALLKGKVVRFKAKKVPQVGWNSVLPEQEGLLKEGFAYFTNSYFCKPQDTSVVAGESNYFRKFACAVRSENIFAVQFHPERSGEYGLGLLRRWVEC